MHSALPFAYFYSTVMFLADCHVWPQRGRVTRERGIKGTNTFDRLTRDEPWGHTETAFDTEAHIFGVQPWGTYVTVTRAFATSSRENKLMCLRVARRRRCPKSWQHQRQNEIIFHCWSSDTRGHGAVWLKEFQRERERGKKKSLHCEWNAQHLMDAHPPRTPFFFYISKKSQS